MQIEESEGDRSEHSERVHQSVGALELTLLVRATGFERLEKLFDDPARTIKVDDILDLLRCVDGLERSQQPLYGLDTPREMLLHHVDNVQRQRLGQRVGTVSPSVGIVGAFDRHPHRSKLEHRRTSITGWMVTPGLGVPTGDG